MEVRVETPASFKLFTLLRHWHLRAIAAVADAARHVDARGDQVELIDSVHAVLAIESIVLRVLRAHGGVDLGEHVVAHGRARFALLRIAGSNAPERKRLEALTVIAEALRDRPYALVTLARQRLGGAQVERLGDQAARVVAAFWSESGSSRGEQRALSHRFAGGSAITPRGV